jgi:hypothetical protein
MGNRPVWSFRAVYRLSAPLEKNTRLLVGDMSGSIYTRLAIFSIVVCILFIFRAQKFIYNRSVSVEHEHSCLRIKVSVEVTKGKIVFFSKTVLIISITF